MAKRSQPTRGQRLTLAEHRELGVELERLDARSTELFLDLQMRYGKASKQSRRSLRLLNAVRNLRSALDDALCADNAHLPNEVVLSVYYPPCAPDSATALRVM